MSRGRALFEKPSWVLARTCSESELNESAFAFPLFLFAIYYEKSAVYEKAWLRNGSWLLASMCLVWSQLCQVRSSSLPFHNALLRFSGFRKKRNSKRGERNSAPESCIICAEKRMDFSHLPPGNEKHGERQLRRYPAQLPLLFTYCIVYSRKRLGRAALLCQAWG